LVIEVVDGGPGIPESELDRVFQPFHRGDSASSSHRRGSGLGLAIAKGFVEANGGRISAQSPPGRGTTIVIELPVPSHGVGERTAAHTERVS
jgi:signal transduction histidine kinase